MKKNFFGGEGFKVRKESGYFSSFASSFPDVYNEHILHRLLLSGEPQPAMAVIAVHSLSAPRSQDKYMSTEVHEYMSS